MSEAISSQGTIVKRNNVAIGELRDITPPALTRNTFDTTNQNDGDNSYVVGIRRMGELQFDINFLPSGDVSHGFQSGLLQAWKDGTRDLYTLEFPDDSSWLFSGFVTNVAPKAPVDGAFSASVTVRPTNTPIFA